jgi:hypothetical protein
VQVKATASIPKLGVRAVRKCPPSLYVSRRCGLKLQKYFVSVWGLELGAETDAHLAWLVEYV